jgi:hypothetical protein
LRPFLLVVAAVLPACFSGPADTTLDVIFDPCATVVVEPSASFGAAERQSVADAIAMWNRAGETRLTLDGVDGAPRLRVELDDAAGNFHGLYEDELGVIVINRALTDPHARAVTIAHELGHAFGLVHVAGRPSVMNPGNLAIEPDALDFAGVVALWSGCAATAE